ncbi:MAG: DUF3592 domain-containing protein [Opitutaceae bacterium]|jgi:4-amino-4-deoxy-L-arabinose transferase-like glycosyltransferase|nr:DUF3592 domain-containing protein [Opitutaceae bacterium]
MSTNSIIILLLINLAFIAGIVFGFVIARYKIPAWPPRSSEEKITSVLPWMLCFTGAGILFFGAICSACYSWYFLSNSIQTEATVTRFVEEKQSDGHVNMTFVYQYLDAKGKTHEDRPNGDSGRMFQVGDKIPIRYLKNNPRESRLDYTFYHWGLTVILLVVSPGLLALGAGLRWWQKNRQKKADQMQGLRL